MQTPDNNQKPLQSMQNAYMKLISMYDEYDYDNYAYNALGIYNDNIINIINELYDYNNMHKKEHVCKIKMPPLLMIMNHIINSNNDETDRIKTNILIHNVMHNVINNNDNITITDDMITILSKNTDYYARLMNVYRYVIRTIDNLNEICDSFIMNTDNPNEIANNMQTTIDVINAYILIYRMCKVLDEEHYGIILANEVFYAIVKNLTPVLLNDYPNEFIMESFKIGIENAN